MESYRGKWGQCEPADLALHGDDDDEGPPLAGDDEIGLEPPPVSVGQEERRMQVRAYNYWASLLGDRSLPRIQDVTAGALPDIADHAVILDFSQGTADPAVTMLGEKLAEQCDAAPPIRHLSDLPGGSLLSRITEHSRQMFASEAPFGFETEFVNQRGKTLLCRGILLPFAGSGDTIQHIMGVINWKELADPIVTSQLRQQLDIAARAAPPAADAPVAHDETKLAPLFADRSCGDADAGGWCNSTEMPETLGAWADGPAAAEPGQLDPAPLLVANHTDGRLDDWLATARESADMALGLQDRSRAALYAAIGRAWDFALAAEISPLAFRELAAEAALAIEPGAPMVPVARLVFGAAYDKTGLAEIAAALDHARRHGVECGGLAGVLARTSGGLKRIVREERQWHRAARGRQGARL